MRLSKLNIKKMGLKDVEENYAGEDILSKLGELYKFESGIYGYGNIWTKMERKVEDIIIDELDKADCIHVEFPKLQPKAIWERSNRWNLYTKENDIMFTLDNNLGEYGLAPTAEECATLFGANRLPSYKNLPATYYQISEKFRKEKRARGFLFRPRTFVMMDAYSFDKNEEEMKKSYNKMHEVYMNIFKRLNINIISTVSDNGTMGGSVSEEFQVEIPLGEDITLYNKEKNIGINKEILSQENKGEYLKKNGIDSLNDFEEIQTVELGNNFQLGTKYSETMKLYYTDEEGKAKPYYMGCYGIGLGRIIATIIEKSVIKDGNNIKGFSLPLFIAPYKIQIITNEQRVAEGEELYKKLESNNISTIIDDRDGFSIGNRIKDAYALGTPYIVILGNKSEKDKIEVEETKTGNKVNLSFDELINLLNK